jgi:hypothetical protein
LGFVRRPHVAGVYALSQLSDGNQLKMPNMVIFFTLFYKLSRSDMEIENPRVAGSNPARATTFSLSGVSFVTIERLSLQGVDPKARYFETKQVLRRCSIWLLRAVFPSPQA